MEPDTPEVPPDPQSQRAEFARRMARLAEAAKAYYSARTGGERHAAFQEMQRLLEVQDRPPREKPKNP